MAISRFEASVARTGNDWVYGDGSDGDVTISGTVTLTSDRYYNNLTVPLGNVLLTNGYRVFVKNTATINGVVGIGTVTGNSSGSTNGTITSGSSVVTDKTLAGTNSGTIYFAGGNGGGASDGSGLPMPSYVFKHVEALTGVVIDRSYYGGNFIEYIESPQPLPITGGGSGSPGSNGTPATSYTNASPAPSGFTNTWPGKAGSAGSAGNTGGWPPNAHTVGAAGGRGGTGNTGSAGSAPTTPIAASGGAGGSGAQGGGTVAIMARTITGSGTIMALGMIGSPGSAGTTSPKGPDGSPGSAGAPAPGYTDHHHHSAVIHDPHTCCGGHTHAGASHDKLFGHSPAAHHEHHHNHSATIHAPCCTAGPHYVGGAGGAGGAGGTGSPAVTGGTGKRGGAGGGGVIIIITETTPSGLSYDVRPGSTADSDTYSAQNGAAYVILNR